MNSKCTFFISLLGIIIILYGCANQIPLTGGDKDIYPPQIDTLKSSPNYQTQYHPKSITLFFDEFINLRSPSKNIVISPPLALGMDVGHRGKKITIDFAKEEILKSDATYLINFGESIADFTEGNRLDNFLFVFSTGDYIDSLTFKGKVLDAMTNEPVENMTVMLFEETQDSVVFTQKPFYFIKTDRDGIFEFSNLRSDTFKVAAVNDLNLNYTYEPQTEKFAFTIDPIIIDTIEKNITLYAFENNSLPLFQESKVVHDGLVSLSFDVELMGNPVKLLNEAESYTFLKDKEVMVYVKDLDLYPIQFQITSSDTLQDTISVRRPLAKDLNPLPLFKISTTNVDRNIGLHPNDTLKVFFNLPIDSLDYTFFQMPEKQIFIDSADSRILNVINNWEEGEDYSLSIDSLSVVDIYGRTIDSTGISFEIARQTAYGTYDLNFRNELRLQYVVTLTSNDKTIKKLNIARDSTSFTVNELIPGTYELIIVEDVNMDGEWTTGNYLAKQQPEKISNLNLSAIEGNRKTVEEIDLNSIFSDLDSLQLKITTDN